MHVYIIENWTNTMYIILEILKGQYPRAPQLVPPYNQTEFNLDVDACLTYSLCCSRNRAHLQHSVSK